MAGWLRTTGNQPSEQIVDQMAETGVVELEVRKGDLQIKLKRAPAEPGAALTEAASAARREPAGSQVEPEQQFHRVLAPLTGVFYAAPNPSANPYVEVGEWVDETTVVGLIETMKVFNEVMAECRGRVAGMAAQQGQLVQAGDTIVLVDTDALPDDAGEAGS